MKMAIQLQDEYQPKRQLFCFLGSLAICGSLAQLPHPNHTIFAYIYIHAFLYLQKVTRIWCFSTWLGTMIHLVNGSNDVMSFVSSSLLGAAWALTAQTIHICLYNGTLSCILAVSLFASLPPILSFASCLVLPQDKNRNKVLDNGS